MKNFLAASLIAADFWNLDKEIRELKKTRTKWIHYDIMDGHFVPNITDGSCELDSLVKKSKIINCYAKYAKYANIVKGHSLLCKIRKHMQK